MRKGIGGLWIDLSGLDAERVDRIIRHGSGAFTVALPTETLGEGISALALVAGSHETLDYLAVVTGGTRVSDLEFKAQVGPVYRLRKAVDTRQLVAALPAGARKHATPPAQRVRVVPPATWKKLLAQVLALGQIKKADMSPLMDALKSRSEAVRSELPDVITFERDAVATAFELLGGSTMRKLYITSSAPTPDAPFITRLRHRDITPIEDTMIAHDCATFPGIKALEPCIVGAMRLKTAAGTLTVLNANRTKIEKTLGVDLVYYNHRHESFTLVQYKRMLGDEDPVYRPDANLNDELRRMRQFERGSVAVIPTYESLRMIYCPFFLKLCKPRTPGDWNGRMLSGMYFPLHLWDLLVRSSSSRGVRDGIAIGFENAKRRFTNSEFTGMLREGWIGTAGGNTERINDILVEQLAAKHSVVAAFHEPDRVNVDYPRDNHGRFAPDDDEMAI